MAAPRLRDLQLNQTLLTSLDGIEKLTALRKLYVQFCSCLISIDGVELLQQLKILAVSVLCWLVLSPSAGACSCAVVLCHRLSAEAFGAITCHKRSA